jgi:hypothetical protein
MHQGSVEEGHLKAELNRLWQSIQNTSRSGAFA